MMKKPRAKKLELPAYQADDRAYVIVRDYLNACGGLACGFGFQRHENKMARAISKALRAAFADGVKAQKTGGSKP